MNKSNNTNIHRDLLNQFISTALLNPSMTNSKELTSHQMVLSPISTNSAKASNANKSISTSKTGMVAQWQTLSSQPWIAVVFYSELFLSSKKDLSYIPRFLQSVLKEYELFYHQSSTAESRNDDSTFILTVDSSLFDNTFEALWKRMEHWNQLANRNTNSNNAASSNASTSLTSKGKQQHGKSTNDKKSLKKKTVWHDGTGKVTKATLAQLDRSKKSDTDIDPIEAAMAEDSVALQEARRTYLPSDTEIPSWLEQEDAMDYSSKATEKSSQQQGWSFQSLYDNLSSQKTLSEEDLQQSLDQMKQMLISKNVAQEIAIEICNGVKSKLVGSRTTFFSRTSTTIQAALEFSIQQILSSHRNIDMLRDIDQKRSSRTNRPYIIVMVGINGVGKSTSLAKLAYYLQSNNCSPLLAACDTFRSGAVEQLGVHAKCLNLPLFQNGYAKDPSKVATAAIQHATETNRDVVLIDTAGRMQNNVPLMNALRKLVSENSPDLIVFVGEALVGNDGLNQLQLFDKALSNANRSGVDGIILSKFDTVGEKVGAALSMVKWSGKPVLFTGIGQKYGHLKKLSVNGIIKSLFS